MEKNHSVPLAKVQIVRTFSNHQSVTKDVKLVSAVVLCLIVCFGSAQASKPEPMDGEFRLSYSLQDAPESLTPFAVTYVGDFMQVLMGSSSLYGTRGENQEFTTFVFQLNTTLWLTDKTVTRLGKSMLVGYTTKFSQESYLGRLSSPDPDDAPRKNANSVLGGITFNLVYVNPDAIQSISPAPNMTLSVLRAFTMPESKPSLAARKTITLSNLKQISTGLIMCSLDTDDIFPYVQGTAGMFETIQPYIKNTELFKTQNPNGGGFRFNMSLAGAEATEIKDPAKTIMFYESQTWPDGGRCVSFVDTHVNYVTQQEFLQLSKTLGLKLKRNGKPLPANLGVGKWKID
jgi:hypothetical protein